jgi:hypothetical protein
LSTRPALVLAWPQNEDTRPPRSEDLSIEALVDEWGSELLALRRRSRLRVVPADPLDQAPAA